jgi:hypothetical protein
VPGRLPGQKFPSLALIAAPDFAVQGGDALRAFVGVLSPDGVNRLYAFDAIERTPLVIDVALAVDDLLEPWVRRAALIVPVTLALFASVMAQIVLFRREMRWRQAFEAQLARQA